MSEVEWRQVALCVFRHADRVLVCEGLDRVAGDVFLRPPGGGVEAGETPEEAVLREMEEELQIGVRDVRLLGVLKNEFVFEGAACREVSHVFEASFVDPSTYALDTVPLFEHGWRTTEWIPLSSIGVDEPRPLYPTGLAELLSQVR